MLAYWQTLSDLSLQRFESAVSKIMATSKFFPKPSEIRELCGQSDAANVQRAWSQLQWALDKYGRYDVITFADSALSATVKAMGGLHHLGNMPIKEFETFGWHRFKECYQSYSMSICTIDRAGIEFKTSRNLPNQHSKRLSIGGESAPKRIVSEVANLVEVKRP